MNLEHIKNILEMYHDDDNKDFIIYGFKVDNQTPEDFHPSEIIEHLNILDDNIICHTKNIEGLVFDGDMVNAYDMLCAINKLNTLDGNFFIKNEFNETHKVTNIVPLTSCELAKDDDSETRHVFLCFIHKDFT